MIRRGRLLVRVRRCCLWAALLIAMPGNAVPPPPPPSFVFEASGILADPVAKAEAVAPLFANDVIAFDNGELVAEGKAAWLRWRQVERMHYYGRTLGYSYSSADYRRPGGSLLVVDSFDTIDTANLPPGMVMDARLTTRSTLYTFGSDHLIHTVRMLKAAGFWNRAP